MQTFKPEVQFVVREVKIGRGYYVHMIPHKGLPEDIHGFENEHNALGV